MAVPKKKVSKSRRNMRRFASGNKIPSVTVIFDQLANETRRPHCVSPNGLYKGKKVLSVRAARESQAAE